MTCTAPLSGRCTPLLSGISPEWQPRWSARTAIAARASWTRSSSGDPPAPPLPASPVACTATGTLGSPKHHRIVTAGSMLTPYTGPYLTGGPGDGCHRAIRQRPADVRGGAARGPARAPALPPVARGATGPRAPGLRPAKRSARHGRARPDDRPRRRGLITDRAIPGPVGEPAGPFSVARVLRWPVIWIDLLLWV